MNEREGRLRENVEFLSLKTRYGDWRKCFALKPIIGMRFKISLN